MKKLYSIILSRYWLAGIIFWIGWHSCLTVNAQVSGFVFRDFNADGARTDTLPIEPGVANVTVRVFIDRQAQPIVKTTGANGNYAFSVAEVPPGSLFRLEFVNLPTGYFPGPHGSTSRTTVQFGVAPAVNMNAGVNYPADYCQSNPPLVIPCYVNGDPLKTKYDDGTDIPADRQAATGDVLVAFPYSASGVAMAPGGVMPDHLAVGQQTGALWGLAFQRRTNVILSAAVVKRHAGLGPLGTGGFYKTNMTTKVTTPFLNVQSLGINTGANPQSGLLGDKLMANYDSVAMTAVGRVGIGGVTISEDDKTLYFVNLYDQRIYGLLVGSPARDFINSPITPTAADTISWKIPDPGCVHGKFRAWGIKNYRGQLYIGGVCSAEDADPAKPFADTTNMRAYIYRFDPTQGRTAQFTQVLSFPLSYKRGYADGTDSCANFTNWLPWSTKFPNSCNHNKHVMWPQPMLTDLEFDVDGSLIIGMADRFGFLAGRHNFAPTTTDNGKLYDGFASGDMLRAYNDNGVYRLESNGKAGLLTGSGVNTGQGPGGGEFYGDDYWLISSNGSWLLGHDEIFNGALYLLPGKGEVLTSAYDPIRDVFQSGGFRAVYNYNGVSNRGFVLYSDEPGTFGKASGLGDLEALCDPAPIEIGNRIWYDDNRNGIQDAYEKGIPNIILLLLDMDNGGTQVGQTTTNSEGEYYFNDSNVTPKLLPNHRYRIQIDPQQFTAFNPANGRAGRRAAALVATPQFNLSPFNQTDLYSSTTGINSLGRIIDPYYVIDVVTTDVGQNNHQLDLSVYTCPVLTVARDTLFTCDGESISSLTISGQFFSRDDSVRVVYFDTPQSGTAAYVGGNIIGTYKPDANGLIVVNNPTMPASSGDKKYYVYAILHPVPAQTVCLPYAGSVIAVKPKLKVAGTGGTLTCSVTTLSLNSTVTNPDGSAATNALYKWSGPNNFTSNVANPVITVAGTYTLGSASAECPNSWAYTEIVVGEDKTLPVLQVIGGTKACALCTVVVQATAPNATFVWTGPNGFTSNASQFTTNQEGDYNVKATATSTGCSMSLTVTVYPPLCPTVKLLVPSTTICAGQPSPILSASSTGSTVQFWASTTPVSTSTLYAGNGTSLGTVPVIGGVASLTATALSTANNTNQPIVWYIYATVPAAAPIGGGCLPIDGNTLQINPLPIAPSILSLSAEPRSCSTCSTTLTAVVQPVNAQLLWMGPNGFSSTVANPVVTQEGTYTLVATMSNSCTSLQAVATLQVVTKAISTTAVSVCIRDTPYISYTVTGINFVPAANSATLIFLKMNGDTVQVIKNQPLSGQLLYPGAAVDANGNPIDWPGWKLVGDEWLREDDGLTPSVQFIVSINPVSNSVALYPPPSPLCIGGPKLGLGDYVWKDLDKDGVQDANEPGVANVRVELYTVTNGVRSQSPIKTQLTDINGKYLFDTLDGGAYQVRFVPATFPAGCTLTVANQGDDKLDSDADAAGYSQVVTLDINDLVSPRPNRTIDAGLIFVPTPLTVCSGALTSLTATSTGTSVQFWASKTPLSFSAVCAGLGTLLGTANVAGNGIATLSTTALVTQTNSGQPEQYYIYVTSQQSTSAGIVCKPAGELLIDVKPLPVAAKIVEAYGGGIPCRGCEAIIGAVVDPVGTKVFWTGPDNFTSTELEPAVTKAGFYTVVVTNSNSCATTRDEAEVEALPYQDICPIVTMLSLDAVVCSGSSLSAVSVQTYDMELGNSLQFVLFDQEPTSVSAIYSSGNVIASVSPDVNGIATLTALNGLFVNTGTQPVTRYIYARVLPSPIDALCRPYARIAIQVMPAINFMASIVPPTCIGTQAQPNGQLLISGFDPSYHYSVAANAGSLLTDYNTAPPIPNNGVISNQLVSPSAATTYTVRILAPGNCFLDKQVVLNPVNCLCQTPDCVPLKVRKIK